MINFIAIVLSLVGTYVVVSHIVWVRYRVAKLRLDLFDLRDMAIQRGSQREGTNAEQCYRFARFLNDMAEQADSLNIATQTFSSKLPTEQPRIEPAPEIADLLELFATRLANYISEETVGGWIRVRWLALKHAKKGQEKITRDVIREETVRFNSGTGHFA